MQSSLVWKVKLLLLCFFFFFFYKQLQHQCFCSPPRGKEVNDRWMGCDHLECGGGRYIDPLTKLIAEESSFSVWTFSATRSDHHQFDRRCCWLVIWWWWTRTESDEESIANQSPGNMSFYFGIWNCDDKNSSTTTLYLFKKTTLGD